MKKITSRSGFTLIEIITVLVIVGLLAAVAGQGIISATRGFVLAKTNAETAGKSQMAISRIVREFSEIVDVTTANSTGIVYTRLDGPHSLALVGENVRVANSAALPTAGTGNVLIDRVSGLNLQYFKGSDTWVPGTDDIDLLSAISVDLTLARPDGLSQNFSTTITPRNNGNAGGVPPPSSSAVPPAYDNFCFIGAAAGESVLSMTWPAWLALLLLGLWMAGQAVFRAPQTSPARSWTLAPKTRRSGALLLGLIVTLLVLAVLGAAMFSMFATTTSREISSNLASQAYYLAESGYRYAATEYQDAPDADGDGIKYNPDDKNAVQKSINDHGPYSLASGKQFDITIEPFYFVTASGHAVGDTVIRTSRPGQAPTGQPIPSTGTIQIQFDLAKFGTSYKDYDYTAYSNGNFTLANALTSADPLVKANSDHLNVILVNHPAAAASLSSGGNLTLADAGFYPDRNGSFTIEGNLGSYGYETRSGNTLQNISVVAPPLGHTLPLALTTTNKVVMDPFVRLTSVGTAGSGVNLVSRQIMYRVPIGAIVSSNTAGEKQTYADAMDDFEHWHRPSVFGDHTITNVDGNSAMDVTNTYEWDSLTYPLRVSLIALNWGPTWSDFNTSWFNNGKYLSYDAQVKIRALQEDFYMAGMNIRMNLPTGATNIDDLSGLGISLMRTDSGPHCGLIFCWGDKEGIPDDVTPPADNTPLVTLWEKTQDGLVWLAYRELDNSDYDIAPAYFSDDMESGTTKWTASGPWGQIITDSHSTNHCWTDSPSGNYAPNLDDNSNVSLTSNTINVAGATALKLVFWHKYDIQPTGWFLGTIWYDWGAVEYSKNGGAWTRLDRYAGSQTSWTKASIDLTDKLPANTMRIRFRIRSNSSDNRDGWYIDDVALERYYSPDFDTLLVRVQEKTADSGPFNGQRVNDLRVYIGDRSQHGTPTGSLMDAQRFANPRWTDGGDPVALGEVVWPPDDPADWDSTHDHFTLVHGWVVNTNYVSQVAVTGTMDEPSAILRVNTHTTDPNADSFTQQEIGLHTFGNSSTDVYFDDFGVQLPGTATSNNRGYRSPIQE